MFIAISHRQHVVDALHALDIEALCEHLFANIEVTQPCSSSVHTNYRHLSNNQLTTGVKFLRQKLQQAECKIQYLQRKIAKDHKTKAVTLDDTAINSDFMSIMKEMIMDSYPEDSFQHIFWKIRFSEHEEPTCSEMAPHDAQMVHFSRT